MTPHSPIASPALENRNATQVDCNDALKPSFEDEYNAARSQMLVILHARFFLHSNNCQHGAEASSRGEQGRDCSTPSQILQEGDWNLARPSSCLEEK
jgi:hypothetical protein